MHLSDFDYDLPADLIAQHPTAERSASRLLDTRGGGLADRGFAELPALLAPGDLLVFNDTRVIRARLFGTKESGGAVEVLVERIVGTHEALALIRASHAPRAGSRLRFGPPDDVATATVVTPRSTGGGLATLIFDQPLESLLARHGRLPLPPYIDHPAAAEDEARYQTVYASAPGAVAAPTAGLHFDEALLDRLRACGVGTAMLTLHVGAGTFLPVRTEDLTRHRMHAERFSIPAGTATAIARTRAAGGRVVAVGTTTLRALEASGGEAGDAETDLFIAPGFRFRVADRLLTNFHLPKSTLLILVSAFAGRDLIRNAYAHAVAARYRFFSYGDAMLLECESRRPTPTGSRHGD